jgi:uncharacterized protein YkwD
MQPSRPFLGIVLLGLFLVFPLTLRTTTTAQADARFTGCGGHEVEPTNLAVEARVVELTNQFRATEGLPPLKYNPDLSRAARYHAADMAEDDYFQHDTFDRADGLLIQACDWNERIGSFYPDLMLVAENIASGFTTIEEVFEGWKSSPGHRDNLLTTTNWEVGVGLYNTNWVQDFGWRSDVYPVIINGEALETASPQVALYLYGDWSEMRLRNDDDAWGEWQPFQAHVEWQLNPTDGSRRVEVEMRKGSLTTLSQDEILLTLSELRPDPDHQLYLPLVRS